MNPINLDALKTYNTALEGALKARHGTRGEHSQLLLDAVNLGVEMAFIAATSVLSVAIDVRTIREHLAAAGKKDVP